MIISTPTNKVKVRFVNPSTDRNSSPSFTTYFLLKTFYKYEGKYPDLIEWLPPPIEFNRYKDLDDLLEDVIGADIYLFSSYIWNYKVLDHLAVKLKEIEPNSIIVLGGPHIGHGTDYFDQHRSLYDFVSKPTMPGEYFIVDLFDNLLVGNYNPEDIHFEIRNCSKKTWKFPTYSYIEDNLEEIKEAVTYAAKHNLYFTFSFETTRGCPFKCTFCEWGGGLNTKLVRKDLDLIKKELILMKEAGVKDVFLADSNFGVFFERDMEILRFTESIGLPFGDISLSKSRKVETHLKVLKAIAEITNSDELRLSFQTISDDAIMVADRLDLSKEDKYILAKEVAKYIDEQGGQSVFIIELILGLPGSTLEDFYDEFDWLETFNSLDGYRHVYMFLPDATSSNPEYQKKHGIDTIRVYQTDFDLIGDVIDGTKSIFDEYRFEYDTVRSCLTYTVEDMEEMFFMNYAYKVLYESMYDYFNSMQVMKVSSFLKLMYVTIKTLDEFKPILRYISKIYDASEEMMDISTFHKVNIRSAIGNLIEKHKAVILTAGTGILIANL